MRIALAALLLLLVHLPPVWAQTVQQGTLFTSQTTGAADTAVTVTLAAGAAERGHLYKVTARCSAGTSALTVQSPSGTTIWSTATGAVGTTNVTEAWSTGLTGATNTAIVVTLATCGVGNTGTLAVQGDRYPVVRRSPPDESQ